jgi:hypothetical protein
VAPQVQSKIGGGVAVRTAFPGGPRRDPSVRDYRSGLLPWAAPNSTVPPVLSLDDGWRQPPPAPTRASLIKRVRAPFGDRFSSARELGEVLKEVAPLGVRRTDALESLLIAGFVRGL